MQPGQREYQHFIPQFLLRNFSHPFVCPDTAGALKKCKKRHHEKKKYPGDPVLNCLDISSGHFSLQECPVSRVCGQYDMYINVADTSKVRRRLETKFSNLEREASRIYHRIISAYESGQSQVGLTRNEKDLLRKFIFLLKYRGAQFHQKYCNPKSINDYQESDKELLEAYMKKRGFHRTMDVWFESLEAIIDIEMDADREWEQHIMKKMYFSEAAFFIDRIQTTYLAICTPETTEEEFILTDTSFNVREGPTTSVQDENTGEFSHSSHCFHEFSTLSPRLMLVLRSLSLPEPIEDTVPEVRADRRSGRLMFFGPEQSILEDLSVHKASCDYLGMRNARRVHAPGRNPVYRKDDRFYFKIFRISKRHVRCINGLLLDHAYPGSRIVFNNQDAFLDLMEWFLTEPCEVGKGIDGEDRISRLRYLLNLTRFMADKGRDIQLICNLLPIQTTTDVESSRLMNIASSRMQEEMMTGNTADFSRNWTFDGIYEKLGKFIRRIRAARKTKTRVLGGTQASFAEDMDQSILMLSFFTRISYWSREIPETVRGENYGRIVDAYQRLPSRRFWMYLKRIRFTQSMLERGIWSTEHPSLYDDQNWRGPEDLVTYGQSSYSQASCFV